ncbi:MAG: hypothetical protein ACHQM6_05470 [Candidatus Kapaibacterium sp.]
MMTQTISIPLDTDVANFYLNASDQEKLRLQWLLNLWLKKEVMDVPKRSLEEIMDEAGRSAKESGLTEEVLREILSERP